MTELIIKNDIGTKSGNNIDNEKFQGKKIKIINKPDVLTDKQLSEKLSGEISDMLSCSDNDCREVIKNHRPVFSSGLEKWL
jgi:hypothetical protein